MNNKLIEAEITGETLTHTIHTEDLLTGGSKAADFALTALYAVYDMLQGSTPKEQVNVTCKWDGAPSVAAATNFHGKKFVATKGFFAKDRKIAYTEEDCDRYFGHAPDLAKKLKLLLGLLDEIQIPADQIWQGDFLFDKDSLKVESIDGDRCVTFHPNTIVYAVPANDPLARAMQAATVGVVWHTRYRGEDFDTLKISFDANADELSSTSNAFCMDARLPSIAGKITLTEDETHKIHALLEEATSLVEDCKASGSLDRVASDEELQLYLNTFENYVIKSRMQQLDKSPSDYLKELREWVVARYDKEIAAKKQPKTQQAYVARKEQALSRIDELMPELVKIVQAQKLVVAIKEFFIAKLNRAGSFKTIFKTIDKGFVPTGHEGYAISDINGNIQKFVSRLEFSYGNFSKDIVKGWMSDKRAQESAKLSAESFLREKMTVPELKQQIISNTEAAEDPATLVKAYNAFNTLDLQEIKKILSSHYTGALLEELVPVVAKISYDVAIDNTSFLKMLNAISAEGLIPVPDDNIRMDFGEIALTNASALAQRIGLESDEGVAMASAFLKVLMPYSTRAGGINVGEGEVCFALLMKGGSKRGVGDLDIQGVDVEVKGVGARLCGTSNMGGLNSPSEIGGRIRAEIKKLAPSVSPSSLNASNALNISTKGVALLVEALPLVRDKNELAEMYVDHIMSVPKLQAKGPYRASMIAAVLSEDWHELFMQYAMYNFAAYQQAAGWNRLLTFAMTRDFVPKATINPKTGKKEIKRVAGPVNYSKPKMLMLSSTPEKFREAIEAGLIKAATYSFSPGLKEVQEDGVLAGSKETYSGLAITLNLGETHAEVATRKASVAAERALAKKLSSEKRQADARAKAAAKRDETLAAISKVKAIIAEKENLLKTITASAKRAAAQRVLDSSKQRLARLEQELGK